MSIHTSAQRTSAMGFEALVRSLLIGLHQAAIVRDIGLEDRREPALTLACQLRIPLI